MKIIEIHKIIMKIMKKQRTPCDNNEQQENNENHVNPKIHTRINNIIKIIEFH